MEGLYDQGSFFFKTFCTFFFTFASSSAYLIFPAILNQKGYSYVEVGIIIGTFSISNTLFRIPFSHLTRYLELKNITVIGMALICISNFTYLLSEDYFLWLFLTRIVHGMGFSMVIVGLFTYIAKEIPEARRYLYFINVGIVMMGSAAFIPIITEILIRNSFPETLYLSSLLYSLVSFLFIDSLAQKGPIESEPVENYATEFKSNKKVFFILLLITWIFSNSQASILNFVGLLLNQRNLGMGGMYIWACLFSAVITSLIIHRHKTMPDLGIAYLLLALGSFILTVAEPNTIYFGSSALLNGVAMAFGFASLNQYASEFGSRSQKATTMAVFTFTYDFGFITGTIVSGLIAEIYSLKALFQLTGILSFLGLWGASIFLRSRKEAFSER